MTTDLLIQLFVAVISGGFITKLFDRLFMSKKDTKSYEIILIETLQKEIERLNHKVQELERDYREKYDPLAKAHNELIAKYNALIEEYKQYKQQHP
jgi:flagellar capping protein FliD